MSVLAVYWCYYKLLLCKTWQFGHIFGDPRNFLGTLLKLHSAGLNGLSLVMYINIDGNELW